MIARIKAFVVAAAAHGGHIFRVPSFGAREVRGEETSCFDAINIP